MSSRQLEDRILGLLKSKPRHTFRLVHIVRELEAGQKQRRQISRALQKLVREGKVRLFRNKHYGLAQAKEEELQGILAISGRSARVTLLSRPSPDIPTVLPVKRSDIAGAMHGDKVAIRLSTKSRRTPEPIAVVTRVLERARKTLVGRFQFSAPRQGFVIPRDTRIKRPVLIPQIPPRTKVNNNDWVVVKIVDYTQESEPLIGKIKEVISPKDKPGIDIYIIIRDYGVEPKFPRRVLREVRAIAEKPLISDAKQRRDLRNVTTFTIDPSTAKDFDDAISIEHLPNGLFRLGVHIADVSHYVQPDTALDKEARDRGTSIYPIDRVVPMLPEQLSNNICSLRPDEDRSAFSVIMDIDTDGEVVRTKTFPSIIRSRYRMTYEEVEALYNGSDHWTTAKYADIIKEIALLFELTRILIHRRDSQGRLDLDIPEGEIIFNSAGEVIDIRRRARLFSHRTVEEAMLLANETVARFITERGLPCIYRIHEPPDKEKLDTLLPALVSLGIDIDPRKRYLSSRRLQRILAKAESIQQGWILRRLILRAMKRAVYSAENKGHFGIATECYTHFTSPIRRYPDVMVHRILREAIKRKHPSPEIIARLERELPEIAAISSEREQRAENIEREAFLVKSLEFMKHQIGEEFEGSISGVSPWGFYVEIDLYPVEGMVSRRTLPDDVYRYIEEEQILQGLRRRKKFKLGDRVLVMVERVDIERRHLDFRLLATIPAH
ncbi:ribonuclease R [Candidatus Sumerlaeota bacterium]|nr:ribonuclease R [Candidatus Sumerlaeota bacterium]